jgi:asparagine synthase (glutamine-hydrolysing)
LARVYFSARRERALGCEIFGTSYLETHKERSLPTPAEDYVAEDMEVELPTILRYADKNSMAFSVEVRLPFLDPNLVNLVLGLSMRTRMAGGQTKALLRAAVRELVPREIVERKDKVGYDVPEVEWLKERGEAIAAAFAGPPWRDVPTLGGARLPALFRQSLRRGMTPREARLFWRILIAGRWFSTFSLSMDGSAT